MIDKSECSQQFWDDLKSGKFATMVKDSVKGRKVSDSQTLYNILKPLYVQEPDVEKGHFIFLNSKNSILSMDCMFTGTLTASAIYPREVAKRILFHQAAAFIMSHNHPSGETLPSREDEQITMQLVLMAHSIGVTFHEHIIIGDGYFSMADNGMIHTFKDKCLKALT